MIAGGACSLLYHGANYSGMLWTLVIGGLGLFIPSMIYVVATYFIGIYVASALFIGAFMYWHGRFAWTKIIPVSLSVPVVVFLLFEVWFLVPLPKGPLETLIGY